MGRINLKLVSQFRVNTTSQFIQITLCTYVNPSRVTLNIYIYTYT